jgi:hypothetical protein
MTGRVFGCIRTSLAAALTVIIPVPCSAQDITLLCVTTNVDNHPMTGDIGNVVEVWLNPPQVLQRHVNQSSRAEIDATSIKAWYHDTQKQSDGTENIQDGFEVIDRVTGGWYEDHHNSSDGSTHHVAGTCSPAHPRF